jgi:hypothetical protein
MPASRKDITFPPWVERLGDDCLAESVKEALLARSTAVRSGALKDKHCKPVFRSADTTIEQIEFGRVSGPLACTKAVTAMRKFATAAECAAPTVKTRRRRG